MLGVDSGDMLGAGAAIALNERNNSLLWRGIQAEKRRMDAARETRKAAGYSAQEALG
jgi:hypothetical protein